MKEPSESAAFFRLLSPLQPDGEIDVLELARAQDCQVKYKDLNTPEGGPEALLVPLTVGGFAILVDKRPSPKEKWESLILPDPLDLQKALVRNRIAHEIGHTLFYKSGRPPTRVRPALILKPDPMEELFCNQFAAALLVPPEEAVEVYSQGPDEIIQVSRQKIIHAYPWLLSANQAKPIRAFAGWAHYDGKNLITGKTFSFGMSKEYTSWLLDPGIKAALTESMSEDDSEPSISRRFLAFPELNNKEARVVLEPVKSLAE